MSITTDLQSKGFVEKNADELRTWMKNKISDNEASNSVVVFAKDIIPDTVFEDFTPNVLIKKYLECAGKVVWLGDVPFWYKGVLKNFVAEKDFTYRQGAYFGNLGVKFVHSLPAEPVRHTFEGKKLGLVTEWYGVRPIYARKCLGNSFFMPEPTLNHKLIVLARSRTFVMRHFIEKKAKFRLTGFQLPVLGGGLDFEGADESQLEYKKNLINSFKIIFDYDFPNQGFIRLWDYPIHEVSNEMLSELETIATYGLK